MFDLFGWIACGFSLTGTVLATCYARKQVMWGWACFLAGSLLWFAYALSLQAMPIIAYNIIRIALSIRGVHNNSLRKIKARKAAKKVS